MRKGSVILMVMLFLLGCAGCREGHVPEDGNLTIEAAEGLSVEVLEPQGEKDPLGFYIEEYGWMDDEGVGGISGFSGDMVNTDYGTVEYIRGDRKECLIGFQDNTGQKNLQIHIQAKLENDKVIFEVTREGGEKVEAAPCAIYARLCLDTQISGMIWIVDGEEISRCSIGDGMYY